MNIKSTHISASSAPRKVATELAQQQLNIRIETEAKDSYRANTNGVDRSIGGAFAGGIASLAGAAAGAGVVAGMAQMADALIPGDAFPVTAMVGPVAGIAAGTLATMAFVKGGVKGFQGNGGAHTNALTTREAFRASSGFAATAAGSFLGGTGAYSAAQAFFPQYTLAAGLTGAALGAIAGAKVGGIVEAFGGNLATIPLKRSAGLEGSKYTGVVNADPPAVENQVSSKFTPIFDDKPTTADVMKTLAEAKESIYFETYLLNGDDGKAVCDMLIKKKKEGLDVKVILDPFFQNFEAKRYEGDERYSLGSYLKDNGVDYTPYATSKLTGSMTPSEHAKILVVDNKTAYVGGTNIDDTNNQDTNVKIEGPAAKDIAKLFHESWAVSNHEDPNVLGLIGDPTISDPKIEVFSTSPSRSTVKKAVIDNIREARESIKIQMFTFTDDELVDELKAASNRGVKVQLQLCDNKEIFHLPTFHVPNLPTALQAKKSGVEVKWYVNNEKNADGEQKFTQMHSKLMIFDDKKTMLGSMNGIHNAFRGIHEYYSEINDEELSQKMSAKFQNDWDNYSEDVTSNLGFRALGAVVEGLDGTVF